jgi:queuosine precursor transporter
MVKDIKNFKHLDTITAFFVAVLIISNVASAKIVTFGFFTFDGGTLLFPLSYIFGDILTEVYGYKRSRKVIWLGFISIFVMATVFMLVGALPAASDWKNQDAFDKILGLTPRIVMASLVAFLAGEFSNSFVLAKLKIATKGRLLWIRTIGSTVVGELIDSGIFILIAFWGILPSELLMTLVLSNYIFKTGIEVILTPLTYKIINFLKKEERENYFDYKTDFNPFKIHD